MWDSRENSFSKIGRARWSYEASYEAYSSDCENQAQCRSTFARMRPTVTLREDPASQQRVNVQQRSSYRQQRSSWQQDSCSWYTTHVNFLLRPSLSRLPRSSRYSSLQRLVSLWTTWQYLKDVWTTYSFLYAHVKVKMIMMRARLSEMQRNHKWEI